MIPIRGIPENMRTLTKTESRPSDRQLTAEDEEKTCLQEQKYLLLSCGDCYGRICIHMHIMTTKADVFKLILFNIYVSSCMHAYTMCMQVSTEARRGCQIPWN